jgi:DNA gyrase subunit A
MSVIVGRALPDVRDGLKPVHRRVLFAMGELNNDWNKPHKKSARIVGDVIGKYHPHGDTAVYDTIVRMAQNFSMRYVLIDGQGNFGSIDGDNAAAMRYTEIRMSRLAHTLLTDLEKETVDFVPNYDETEMAPAVLPSAFPNLLVNGSSGIAVGMATNIPPHNLGEVIDACLALIDNPLIEFKELLTHISGPDFPTAGIINGRAGILQAYKTGRGKILVRGRASVEVDEKNQHETIVITELPYQVNKARLIEKIAELVKTKRIEGITAIRDESDKDGLRVVIEVRRNENGEVILNNLYALTQLQNVFGINMVALVDGQPKQLSLKTILECFVDHRREVVTRRTIYDLRKARERAHILEGLGVALANIDEIIALIKASKNPQDAKESLLSKPWGCDLIKMFLGDEKQSELCRPDTLLPQYGLKNEGYFLSVEQAQAILDLRLHRLTGLEKDKIFDEYKSLIEKIRYYIDVLSNQEKLMTIIREELLIIREQFNDKRRTEIVDSQLELTTEDLIDEEEVAVTLSHEGYVKSQLLSEYRAQRRGGRGKQATALKTEDFIECLLIANSHDTILCFSSVGKVYWLKVYQLPQSSRTSRGRPIINLLPLKPEERITAILPVKEFSEEQFVLMATSFGTVKKVKLSDFSRPRTNGIIAVELIDNDCLVGVGMTDGKQDIMLFTDEGKVIRFNESVVRCMGRTARGVRGIKLGENQKVISLIIAGKSGAILTATANGYGKRTDIEEYRVSGRSGQGVISIQVTPRNGKVIGAIQVDPDHEVMLLSDRGTMVRTRVKEISLVGRNTQGVRLINLNEGEVLIGLQRIEDSGEEEGEDIEESESQEDTTFFDSEPDNSNDLI